MPSNTYFRLATLLLPILLLGCQTQDEKTPPETKEKPPLQKKSPALQTLLDSAHLRGVVLVYDEAANTYHASDYEWANTGQLPASTFKIPNTLIALETGVAASPEHLFKWDGTDRWLDAWEQDLTLKEAFAASCVPCYQEVARTVGRERMRAQLDKLAYTGMVFDSTTVDNFWLGGDSRITPFQQIQFLQRLHNEQLPIQASTQAAIRDIMVRERTKDYVLSGKTGWSVDGEKNNGWFVGFVERGDRTFYFATNVEPGPGFDMAGFANARVRVTRLELARLGIL